MEFSRSLKHFEKIHALSNVGMELLYADIKVLLFSFNIFLHYLGKIYNFYNKIIIVGKNSKAPWLLCYQTVTIKDNWQLKLFYSVSVRLLKILFMLRVKFVWVSEYNLAGVCWDASKWFNFSVFTWPRMVNTQ